MQTPAMIRCLLVLLLFVPGFGGCACGVRPQPSTTYGTKREPKPRRRDNEIVRRYLDVKLLTGNITNFRGSLTEPPIPQPANGPVPYDVLEDSIRDNIDPDVWTGAATVEGRNGILIVHAPRSTVGKVADHVNALKQVETGRRPGYRRDRP